jgi:hypothetical protein
MEWQLLRPTTDAIVSFRAQMPWDVILSWTSVGRGAATRMISSAMAPATIAAVLCRCAFLARWLELLLDKSQSCFAAGAVHEARKGYLDQCWQLGSQNILREAHDKAATDATGYVLAYR